MSSVGFDTFFPKTKNTIFIVKNITTGTKQEKNVRVFSYPIPPGKERDLLEIPYVSEADIRHALLKGDLRIKLELGELRITQSNIDLLQFDSEQRNFLISVGVDNGLDPQDAPGSIVSATQFLFKQNVGLLGVKDESNRVFTTPDKFINSDVGGNSFRILIRHNGKGLLPGIDYVISESTPGDGFDTITIVSFAVKSTDTLVADYVLLAP